MSKEKRTLLKECEGQRGPGEKRLEGRNLDISTLHQAQMLSVPPSMCGKEDMFMKSERVVQFASQEGAKGPIQLLVQVSVKILLFLIV